jgi:hypothetical protein
LCRSVGAQNLFEKQDYFIRIATKSKYFMHKILNDLIFQISSKTNPR